MYHRLRDLVELRGQGAGSGERLLVGVKAIHQRFFCTASLEDRNDISHSPTPYYLYFSWRIEIRSQLASQLWRCNTTIKIAISVRLFFVENGHSISVVALQHHNSDRDLGDILSFGGKSEGVL